MQAVAPSLSKMQALFRAFCTVWVLGIASTVTVRAATDDLTCCPPMTYSSVHICNGMRLIAQSSADCQSLVNKYSNETTVDMICRPLSGGLQNLYPNTDYPNAWYIDTGTVESDCWTLAGELNVILEDSGYFVNADAGATGVRCECDAYCGLYGGRSGSACLDITAFLARHWINCDGSQVNAAGATVSGGTGTTAADQPFGSTIQFSCSPGFLAATLTYTCGENEQFATSDPQCVPVTCDGTLVGHRGATVSGGNGTTAPNQPYGSTIEFFCSDKGFLPANKTYTCGQDGKFTTTDGRCVPVTCNATTVSHDNAILTGGNSASAQYVPVSGTMEFTCIQGYYGTATYTCEFSGLFETNDGPCSLQPIFCSGASLSVDGAELTAGSTRGNQTVGSTVEFSCLPDYEEGITTFTCNNTGEFQTDDPLNCTLVVCDGTTVSVANATTDSLRITSKQNGYGSIIEFTCSVPFVPATITYMCERGNKFVTTDKAECVPITCDGQGVNQQGSVSLLSGTFDSGQAYGSTMVLACTPGNAVQTVTYTCMESGQFESDGSSCNMSGVGMLAPCVLALLVVVVGLLALV